MRTRNRSIPLDPSASANRRRKRRPTKLSRASRFNGATAVKTSWTVVGHRVGNQGWSQGERVRRPCHSKTRTADRQEAVPAGFHRARLWHL